MSTCLKKTIWNKNMKHVLLLFSLCTLALCVQAQPSRLSEEEFRAKQREYITQRAGLTEDEAEKFFPLYFELQDKKRELNEQCRELNHRGTHEELTDDQYWDLMEQTQDIKLQSEKLEGDYLKRFKKVLSGKKLFMVQRAEMNFHMDMVKGMRPGGDRKKGGEGKPPR